jgi:hypothetical protein
MCSSYTSSLVHSIVHELYASMEGEQGTQGTSKPLLSTFRKRKERSDVCLSCQKAGAIVVSNS